MNFKLIAWTLTLIFITIPRWPDTITTTGIMQYQQFYLITGGVGVGKSTLISNLLSTLPKDDCAFIKECIEYKPDEGKQMLKETLHNKRMIYQFQLFVLQCFEEQFSSARFKKHIILERSPMDSLHIFATESYNSGDLSKEEFEDIKTRTVALYEKYHIPTYTDCVITKIDSCKHGIQEVFQIVKRESDECYRKRRSILVWLYCSDPLIQKSNIENRGRPEEKNYDINYMLRINQEYERLLETYV